MNSRQLNFYVSPDELHQLQTWLLAQDLVFIKQPILDADDFLDIENSAPAGNQEWSKIYLTKESYARQIILNYNETLQHYSLDEWQSWAVEFSRPAVSEKYGLTRCRFYFITGYYGQDHTLLKKDAAFIQWAADLVKKFKKEFLVKFETPQAHLATKGFIEIYNSSMKLTI